MVFVYLQTLEFIDFIKQKENQSKLLTSFIPGTQDPIVHQISVYQACRPNFSLRAVWNKNIPRS